MPNLVPVVIPETDQLRKGLAVLLSRICTSLTNFKSNDASLFDSNVSFNDDVENSDVKGRGDSNSSWKPDKGQHQSIVVMGKIRQFEAFKGKNSRTPVKVICSKLTPKKKLQKIEYKRSEI